MQCFCLCAKTKANVEMAIWEPDPRPISIQSQFFREPETTAQRREVGGWVDLSAVGPASGWVRGLGGATGGVRGSRVPARGGPQFGLSGKAGF